jgi:glycosyltransferase involved in cell wall biosynthesis
MKVSAIIPTFNRRNYIRRAIDSVLAQTTPVDEIIVVDDGSTDGTAEALETWYGSRVRVVRQENSGVSGARRLGIQEACGEWIAFLDSDDEWTPERNEKLLAAAAVVPRDVAWIFGNLRIVTDEGDSTTLFEKYGLSLAECPDVFSDPLSVQYPFQFGLLQGSFIRRNVLLELDCFDAGLRSSEDLLAGFQVACRYKFAAIPSVVGRYFLTSDLAASSATVNGVFGPDYFRARMLAFTLDIESGRKRPWNRRYASEVRGLCQVLASQGKQVRGLALQQFRFGGVTAKGIAFLCAAMLGRGGIKAWNALAESRRKNSTLSRDGKTGLQAYLPSVVEKTRQHTGPHKEEKEATQA